mmetsp:Transcript_23992/g.35212  ORF Transcript_23992/g.35212 Transcript_23992/m.35212 type:complete len:156 (+) Transcript_23992:50-517(+)
MTARRYRKVPQYEANDAEESKKEKAEQLERVSTKIHALFWVAAAVAVIIYTDFINVLLHSERVNRFSLNIAIALFFANVGIVIYLTLWLPLVQKVTVSWDIYCPRMIPTATLLGVLCIIFSISAFWPIWGFLSPLVITMLVLGFVFSTHFIPWPC